MHIQTDIAIQFDSDVIALISSFRVRNKNSQTGLRSVAAACSMGFLLGVGHLTDGGNLFDYRLRHALNRLNRRTIVSKLLSLKKWVTLSDAAKHLSVTLNEAISESDVIRLAIEEHIVMSVYFPGGVYLRQWEPLELSGTEFMRFREYWVGEGSKGVCIPDGMIAVTEDFPGLRLTGPVLYSRPGILDLTRMGDESYELERFYQKLNGLPMQEAREPINLSVMSDVGFPYQIHRLAGGLNECEEEESHGMVDSQCFSAARSLPHDCYLVVRASALAAFQLRLSEPIKERALPSDQTTNAERSALYKLVLGMAICSYRYNRLRSRNDAPQVISEKLRAEEIYISDETVRKYLRLAGDEIVHKERKVDNC